MTSKLTPTDWEEISAYLDRQLDGRDLARLEQRLKAEPELRQGLQEMQATRAVIRMAPKLRAPRNFTLSPQMAGVRSGRRTLPAAFNLFRFASALATLFFIVLASGSLYMRLYGPAPTVVAVAPQDAGMRPFGMGGGGGGGGGMVEPPNAPLAMEASQPVTESLDVTSEALPEGEEPVLQVTAVGEQALEMGDQPPPSGKMAPGMLEPMANQAPGTTPSPPVTWTLGWSVLLTMLVLLALLAIGSGLAAVYIRRSNS